MADFSVIKDDHLRNLIENSESIAMIPEGNLPEFLAQLNDLPVEGTLAVIDQLEKEKAQHDAHIDADKIDKIQTAADKAYEIKRQFTKNVSSKAEAREKKSALQSAERALDAL